MEIFTEKVFITPVGEFKLGDIIEVEIAHSIGTHWLRGRVFCFGDSLITLDCSDALNSNFQILTYSSMYDIKLVKKRLMQGDEDEEL